MMTGSRTGALVCAILALVAPAGAQPSQDIRSYVLLADTEFRTKGLTIEGGNLGVNDGSFFAGGAVDAPNSQIVANEVTLDPASLCAELFANNPAGVPGCGPATGFSSPIFPDLATACGFPASFPACDPSMPLTLSGGTTVVLPPGVYGDVEVLGGGGNPPSTLVLTGGNYVFCSMSFGREGKLLFQAPSTVNVVGDVELGNLTFTGPADGSGLGAEDLKIFVAGTEVHFSRQSEVRAFLCAPDATLRMTAGTTVIGSFLADVIRTERIGVTTTTTTSTSPIDTSTTTTSMLGVSTTTTTLPGDHFLCYTTTGNRDFTVTLSDQFDTGTYQSFHKQVLAICTPADKNDEGVDNPLVHLKVYRVQGPHLRRTGVEVTNQFGTFLFDTRGTESLMVPAAKTIAPDPAPQPPDPATHQVDHYRCVRIRPSAGSAPLPAGLTVTVEDQFGTRQAAIKRATKLCVPTDKNGEGIERPDLHLTCYKITPTPETVVTGVQIADQFGNDVHRLNGEDELCLPSTKRLPQD
jgi:hypothetical protein